MFFFSFSHQILKIIYKKHFILISLGNIKFYPNLKIIIELLTKFVIKNYSTKLISWIRWYFIWLISGFFNFVVPNTLSQLNVMNRISRVEPIHDMNSLK